MTQIKALLEDFPDASLWTLDQKKSIFKLYPNRMWPELIKAGFTVDGLTIEDVGYNEIPIEVVPEDKIEEFYRRLREQDRKKVANDIINNKIPFNSFMIRYAFWLLVNDGLEDKLIEWNQDYNFIDDPFEVLLDICKTDNLKTKLTDYLLDKFDFSDKLSLLLSAAIKNGHIDTIKQLLDRTTDFLTVSSETNDNCYRLPDAEILTLLYDRIPDGKKLTIYLIKCYISFSKNNRNVSPYETSVLYEFFLDWLTPKEISAIIKSL